MTARDFASKAYLTRPRWKVLLGRFFAQLERRARMESGADCLSRGVIFQTRDGLLYVAPKPAQRR